MTIRHLIAAGSLAAICSTANVAAEPARPSGGNTVPETFSLPPGFAHDSGGARNVTGFARRYRHGAAR